MSRYASPPPFTYSDLLVVQSKHLSDWEKVLKPEVYLALEQMVRENTFDGLDPDGIPDWSAGEYDRVPRGDTITNMVFKLMR